MYQAVRNAARVPMSQIAFPTIGKYGVAQAEARMASLEKKPAARGRPAMAYVAHWKVRNVCGILSFRPPMKRRSCSPLMAWITEPDPRKRQALKKACVT